MLIEFRVENHRSLRDEQALTMEAGRVGESTDTRPRKVAGHNKKMLPAAVIYGANASGKSNLLSAIAFMSEAVTKSHRAWEPLGGIPRTPFAWGNKRDEPSLFEATFLVGGIKYCYGFVVNDESVEEEWLFVWPKNRKQTWFEREGNKFKFGEHLKGPNEVIEEVTRSNALFLSTAAQHRQNQLKAVYGWFQLIMAKNLPGRPYTEYMESLLFENLFISNEVQSSHSSKDGEDSFSDRLRFLIKEADVGIVDIKKRRIEHDASNLTIRHPRIKLQHIANDETSWLDLEEESEGTKTLIQMAPSIFMVLATGGLLLVDELEASLHPLLGQAIIKMFNCPKANPSNAQILFTTHDTNLLGTTLGEPPLRRDQIWFAEKDEKGASRIYPLTDYKPRKSENLERGYLQGRYGAIPFLGDFSWITE